MRLLLVLLACVAATNAYSCTYGYYYQNNFQIYLPANYYNFCVFFKNEWCSTKYYAPILKVYPTDACGKDGWKEKSVDDVVAELKNLLKEALATISREMISKRISWYNYLYTKTYEYMAAYKKFITRYYDYRLSCVVSTAERDQLIRERDQKISDYNSKLYQMKYEALSKYNDALNTKLNLIISFQDKLVENAKKCLETRLEKIAEFTKSLDERISKYVAKFYQHKVAIANCQADYYLTIFQKLFATKSTTAYYMNYVVGYYRSSRLSWARSCANEYSAKLRTYREQLIGFYRCASRCYMSYGCMRFFTKSYYSSCAGLGAWFKFSTKYSITRYCLAPFRYCWRGASYKLKTCDLNKINKPADDVEKEMKEKMEASIKKFTETFFTWKNKWVAYHVKYVEEYCRIIDERHQYIVRMYISSIVRCNGYYYLTYAQSVAVANLRDELKKRKDEAVSTYRNALYQNLSKCLGEFNSSIAAYRTKSLELISSIIGKYESCLSKRATSIADYQKKLEESRNKQRSTLYDNMWDAKIKHWNKYNEMLEKFHGKYYYNYYYVGRMRSLYADKIVSYCDGVMRQFDSYWAQLLPKLVHQYSCCSRCSVAYCSARFYFGSYMRWSFCLPTTSSYCYQYRAYCYAVRYYKVSTCGRYYVY